MATLRRVRPREPAGRPSVVQSTNPRPDRVRCATCGMPVRGGAQLCWSCGADPHDPDAQTSAAGAADGEAVPAPRGARSARLVVVALGLAVFVALIVGTAVLVLPDERGASLRRIAQDLRGEGWRTARIDGLAVDLPPTQTTEALDPASLGPFREAAVARGVDDDVDVRAYSLRLRDGATGDVRVVLRSTLEQVAARQQIALGPATPTVVQGAPGLRAPARAGADGTPPAVVEAAVIGDQAYAFSVSRLGGPPALEQLDRVLASFEVADR